MNFTPVYDVMSIPTAVSQAYLTVKSIAYVLLPLLFVLDILQWTSAATVGKRTSWVRSLYKLIIIFIALAWYRHIIMKVVALAELIGMSICNTARVADLINFVFEHSYAYVESSVDGAAGKVLGSMNALANFFRPKILILGFLSVALSVAEPVLLAVRYTLLSVLYVFGPLAFVGYMFHPTKKILTGWFTGVLQISFWIVILRILESVMLSFNIASLAQQGQFQDIIPWIVICTVFLGMIVLTPIITAKIFSGDNLGEVGSLAAAAATVVTARYGNAAIGVIDRAKTGAGTVKRVYSDTVNNISMTIRRRKDAAAAQKKDPPRR